MKAETLWASPSVPVYSEGKEGKEQQTGAGTPTLRSKSWLEAPRIRMHCTEPSLRSLGALCSCLPTPLTMAEPPSACTHQVPQFLVLLSIHSIAGACQACQRSDPRRCQESRAPLGGLPLPLHLWPALHSLQSLPTSTH